MSIWTHKENVQMWKASIAYILVICGGYTKENNLDIARAEYDNLLTNMRSINIVQNISTYEHAISYLEKHHPIEEASQHA